jgi:hypothetical protein
MANKKISDLPTFNDLSKRFDPGYVELSSSNSEEIVSKKYSMQDVFLSMPNRNILKLAIDDFQVINISQLAISPAGNLISTLVGGGSFRIVFASQYFDAGVKYYAEITPTDLDYTPDPNDSMFYQCGLNFDSPNQSQSAFMQNLKQTRFIFTVPSGLSGGDFLEFSGYQNNNSFKYILTGIYLL